MCYYHAGLESAFRYYYFLSLICCAIRYSTRVTYLTWVLHSASYSILYLALPAEHQVALPLLLIFAGVIGGLIGFGLVGIFVGPVVLAVSYTLLDAWIEDDLGTAER